MTPVGETLRQERMKRNFELEEISHELKISTRFLQAIESDQYDKLPGGVFAKSFVRQYARLLGLDDEAIAGQVQEVLGPTLETSQVAEKSRPVGFAPIQVPKVEEWETVGDKRFRWSGWLSALVLIAVMVVCSVVYSWIQRPKTPVNAQAPSQVAAQHVPVPSAAPPTQPPVVTAAVQQPPAVQTAAVQSPVAQAPAGQTPAVQTPAEAKPPVAAGVTPPNAGATVHVEIAADEPVWVLARADGKYAFSATMDAHTTRTVEAVKEVTLRLGNAGGVTISLNGKAIGAAGPKGQVRTVQFTSGGFQIVPAKPSVPLDPIDRL